MRGAGIGRKVEWEVIGKAGSSSLREGMLRAGKKVIHIFLPYRQRVISRLESVFPAPWLSHDEAFCEQLREDFCYTTGMLGQSGSEILPFSDMNLKCNGWGFGITVASFRLTFGLTCV